jgi:aromatic-L-amino-acid decarboxylase
LEGSFSDPDNAQSSLESMGIPYADFGVELSSPARGVVVWSILRELGRSGVTRRIKQDNDFARQLAAVVRRSDHLELLSEPVLSICCFRYRRDGIVDLDSLNEQVYRRLLRETQYLPSATVVNGSFGLRPCFINPRTSSEHVDGLADAVVRLGDEWSPI